MNKAIFLFVIACFIGACSDNNEEEVKAGKYGMMGSDTPQYTGVLFMRGVYNDKDLSRVTDLSTERYGRILKSYHTNKSIQRQVFNLRLDTMTAEPVSGGTLLFSDKLKEAEIEMKITGHYGNDKIIELKTLSMIKVKGKWKVNDVRSTIP